MPADRAPRSCARRSSHPAAGLVLPMLHRKVSTWLHAAGAGGETCLSCMQLAPGAPPAAAAGGRPIAGAPHDIEPATWARCALIRDWLDDHGVDRVTLLVMPARDLHPLGERCHGIR